MAVYGYCRVSTGRQGDSLEVQEGQVRAAAAGKGLAIETLVVDEAVSGGSELKSRPAGGPMLERLERGDWVFASKLDRVFRSVRDAVTVLEQMRGRGVHLYVGDLGGDVTGNGVAALVFTVMSAVAEFERERIRERSGERRALARHQGKVLGARPFGWRVRPEDGVLLQEPAEQRALTLMLDLRGRGWSWRRIQAECLRMTGLRVSVAGIPAMLERARRERGMVAGGSS